MFPIVWSPGSVSHLLGEARVVGAAAGGAEERWRSGVRLQRPRRLARHHSPGGGAQHRRGEALVNAGKHTQTHLYIHTCTHKHTYSHTWTHTHSCTDIQTCTHTHTHTHTHTRTHTHTYTHAQTYTYTHNAGHTHTDMYIYIHRQTRAYKQIQGCTHMFTNKFVYECKQAHTHTHTHTHIVELLRKNNLYFVIKINSSNFLFVLQ